jgi:PAS domain S-box-containing protein
MVYSIVKESEMGQRTVEIAESILDALGEPVLVVDDKLRAVMANPAFCHSLQIPLEPLKGKTVEELVTGKNGLRQLTKILEDVASNAGDVEGVEVPYTLPDRTRIILSVSARRVSKEQDRRKLILVELRDITQERNAEQRIQELNKALQVHGSHLELMNKELESFAHSVSHDLRTPLRLIDKIAYLLLDNHGAHLPGDAIEKINMIIDGAQEMGKLIETLLTFSRVMRDPVRKRRVDLQRLVREAIADLRDAQSGRVVEFAVEELPSCHVDRALFKQVFLNLLENSLKFTRPRKKAQIRIGWMEGANEKVFFVRDNGVGFDMGKSASLFLAFQRLHKPGEFEGSGVGLALVRRIIERHNGRIWGESEINKGATFYFTLGE